VLVRPGVADTCPCGGPCLRAVSTLLPRLFIEQDTRSKTAAVVLNDCENMFLTVKTFFHDMFSRCFHTVFTLVRCSSKVRDTMLEAGPGGQQAMRITPHVDGALTKSEQQAVLPSAGARQGGASQGAPAAGPAHRRQHGPVLPRQHAKVHRSRRVRSVSVACLWTACCTLGAASGTCQLDRSRQTAAAVTQPLLLAPHHLSASIGNFPRHFCFNVLTYIAAGAGGLAA
jgi:hypothetical protein